MHESESILGSSERKEKVYLWHWVKRDKIQTMTRIKTMTKLKIIMMSTHNDEYTITTSDGA